jgi:hypothetical protein
MKASAAAALLACAALGLGACGGGDSSGSQGSSGSQAETAIRGPQPPKGASALQRGVYRNFQPPRPDSAVPGSAKAIEAGEAACRGKTPLEVKQRYLPESELSAAQRQALTQIDRAEAKPSADFAAGQLAALIYQGTLEGTAAEYGYRGCVYALARGLESGLGG